MILKHLTKLAPKLFISLTFSFLISSALCVAITDTEARSTIIEAEMALSSSYLLLFEAENNGADISEILIQLNVGGASLSKARVDYRTGAYGRAYQNANHALQVVNGLFEKVQNIKDNADLKLQETSFQLIVTSSLAICVVVLVHVVGWWGFKNRYYQKIMEMKPEEKQP